MLNQGFYRLVFILGLTGLVAALVIAALLIAQPFSSGDSGSRVPQAPQPAPAFSLTLLDGGSLKSQDHQGKPLVVNFFASWCLPCQVEAPALEKIAREYGPKGVAVLGIAIDDTEDKLREFTRRHGLSFPVGLDEGKAIQQAFGPYGVPTTYFIDRGGMIRYFHSGAVTEELLRHELDKLL